MSRVRKSLSAINDMTRKRNELAEEHDDMTRKRNELAEEHARMSENIIKHINNMRTILHTTMDKKLSLKDKDGFLASMHSQEIREFLDNTQFPRPNYFSKTEYAYMVAIHPVEDTNSPIGKRTLIPRAFTLDLIAEEKKSFTTKLIGSVDISLLSMSDRDLASMVRKRIASWKYEQQVKNEDTIKKQARKAELDLQKAEREVARLRKLVEQQKTDTK